MKHPRYELRSITELAGKTTKHRRMAERNLRRLNRAHDEWLAA